MKIESTLLLIIFFLAGFLSANLIGIYFLYGTEMPILKGFGFSDDDNQAPSDLIKEDQIKIYPDKVVINIKDASLSRYAATGSMKPVLDKDSNGIRIKPISEDKINVGDIITFEQENNLIVHRVVEKGTDENGIFFITKGDNNAINDSKVRFKDIKYITIAIIY